MSVHLFLDSEVFFMMVCSFVFGSVTSFFDECILICSPEEAQHAQDIELQIKQILELQ